ncbi:anthrone oxygenase family protein [Actinoplanes derwentensis]|uniref:Uncharacterized membrane protein n=1 Tax=Actinoplanes derwentensis TaxID=113562 RepID=A0A1H1RBG0_9ACTN|nr:anthrone oxygenase family protein [Actinoplanes derwentensis]GID88065.1 membrane protein [Actinoplanes derwentensis]SDS33071.1 Uncharacterized membrane protein [Actinoplanes derwentensis]
MTDPVRTTTLFIAAISLGLMAGLFYGYAGSVMPALRRADDHTVIDVMQRINVAIQNPLFGLLFTGALIATGVAAFQQFSAGHTAVWVPLVIGLVLYLATMAITFGVNIPLNNRLAAAGPARGIADPQRVRGEFFDRWVRAHHQRTLTCTGAFAAIVWSLIAYGQI